MDQLSLLFRCDFPHDSYWQSVEVTFSNGNCMSFDTEKQEEFQNFKFPTQQSTFIKLSHLNKAQDDSPFPALTQIEVLEKTSLFNKTIPIPCKVMGYFHQKRDKMREKKLKALKWDSYEEITQGFKLMLEPLKVK